jgi:hypothetical protein
MLVPEMPKASGRVSLDMIFVTQLGAAFNTVA